MNSPDQSHQLRPIQWLPENGARASIYRVADELNVDRIRGDEKTGSRMDTRQHFQRVYPRSIQKNRVGDEHFASGHREQKVRLIQRFGAMELYFRIGQHLLEELEIVIETGNEDALEPTMSRTRNRRSAQIGPKGPAAMLCTGVTMHNFHGRANYPASRISNPVAR